MNVTRLPSENPLFDCLEIRSERLLARIYPNLGGSLQELMIDGNVIIRGLVHNEKGEEEYAQKFRSAILFPFPNRIEEGKIRWDDSLITLPCNEPERNNAIHGLVFDQTFNVEKAPDNNVLLQYHNDNLLFNSPYTLILQYSFSDKGVIMEASVKNTGARDFPFGFGWHPYFEVSDLDQCRVKFEADKRVLVNDEMIPVGMEEFEETELSLQHLTLDDAFRLISPQVILESPLYTLKMNMPEGSFLQLYTPPSRKAIAVEPMTCIADMFNNKEGLRILKPDESFRWKIEIEVSF